MSLIFRNDARHIPVCLHSQQAGRDRGRIRTRKTERGVVVGAHRLRDIDIPGSEEILAAFPEFDLYHLGGVVGLHAVISTGIGILAIQPTWRRDRVDSIARLSSRGPSRGNSDMVAAPS